MSYKPVKLEDGRAYFTEVLHATRALALICSVFLIWQHTNSAACCRRRIVGLTMRRRLTQTPEISCKGPCCSAQPAARQKQNTNLLVFLDVCVETQLRPAVSIVAACDPWRAQG